MVRKERNENTEGSELRTKKKCARGIPALSGERIPPENTNLDNNQTSYQTANLTNGGIIKGAPTSMGENAGLPDGILIVAGESEQRPISKVGDLTAQRNIQVTSLPPTSDYSCGPFKEMLPEEGSASEKVVDQSLPENPFHPTVAPNPHWFTNREKSFELDDPKPKEQYDKHLQKLAPVRMFECCNYSTCLEISAALDWLGFHCSGCDGNINESLRWQAGIARKRDKVAEAICRNPLKKPLS